ncbi:hypothetical protein VMCG_04503 [Cytospora schulzeri]|uniref:Protein kinase domain-containing protein n=1 Tax=Cytospora schulzeri TaxID=448051 RepID=A0A423WRK2_9PEZI|nr:hypothetical protein VMCG_04503 [Valsa malicola]
MPTPNGPTAGLPLRSLSSGGVLHGVCRLERLRYRDRLAGQDNKPPAVTAINYPPTVASVTPGGHEESVTPTSDDEDDIDDECEKEVKYVLWGVENTHDGRLYPFCIGDVFQNRYRVVHRLGRGGPSTVWLARDSKNASAVALKVMIAGDLGRIDNNQGNILLDITPVFAQQLVSDSFYHACASTPKLRFEVEWRRDNKPEEISKPEDPFGRYFGLPALHCKK